jgi:hypothetical protein
MRRLRVPVALTLGYAALLTALALGHVRRFLCGALPYVLAWYAGWLILERIYR